MTEAAPAGNPMLRVLRRRGFRLLTVGSTTSLLGDQFALVATPWLALQLTGDPLTLGLVLALEGIPRALFMLVGGAVTDRLSPRGIMLASDLIRLALTGLMAAAVITGSVHTWMLYAFGLGFGLVAGFAVPAENSIVPTLVDEKDLQAGNSVVMGLGQLAGFVGPSIAGVLIGAYAHSYLGIALAFGIDAVTFAASAVCLWLIGSESRALADGAKPAEGIASSILSGLRYLWNDPGLRVMFIILTAVNFLLMGPIMVGIPVLADQRLPQGAVAFGLLMSAYSGGNLVGYLLAGSLPRLGAKAMSAVLTALLAAFGVVIGSLGFLTSTWVDFALLLALGLGNGYVAIILFTGVQTGSPKEMLGRMMSILMFASTGLTPVSQALAGVISRWDLTLLFVLAGGLVLLVTAWAVPQPGFRAFGESLAGVEG